MNSQIFSKILFFICLLILSLNFNAQDLQNEMFMNENSIENLNVEDKQIPKSKVRTIIIFAEIKNDSTFSVYLKNNLEEKLILIPQDNSMYVIQEALNENKEWKPIEFFGYSTCGNSYDRKMDFIPNQIIELSSKKYQGSYSTKIRFKVLLNDQIYYSNILSSTINENKFEKSKWYKKMVSIYKERYSENEIEDWLFLRKKP